jgi:hypothetical protein
MELQLNTGEYHTITPEDIETYQALYAAIDVDQELKKMAGWILANPKKRKTKQGIKRFVNSWLSRAQDRGGSPASVCSTYAADNISAIDHWIGVDPDVSARDIAAYKIAQYGAFKLAGKVYTAIPDTL